ncbi:hypothetical protein OF83DRAFT_1294750 [Amylostereum chailletii]|nr:hypothetical protein OF83DRAFT_1294750 [Amylostereum chailletii]
MLAIIFPIFVSPPSRTPSPPPMSDSERSSVPPEITSPESVNESVTTCPRFDAPNADIVIQSVDNVLFKVFRKDLNAYSEVFPGEAICADDEVVRLPEDSATLELLLQYMSRQPQPAIEELPFDTLAKLSEAAEKYQVYSAMKICNVFMAQAMPQYPMPVLAYAARHGYESIADKAAPLTLDTTLAEAIATLGSIHVISWILYREAWMDIRRIKPPQVVVHHSPSCLAWALVSATCLEVLSSLVTSTNIGKAISGISCTCGPCRTRLSEWAGLLEDAGGKCNVSASCILYPPHAPSPS